MQNIAKYDCWDPHEYHLGNDDWFSEIDFTSNVRRKRTAVSEDGDQAGGGWRYTKRPEIDERSKWLIEQQHIRRPDVICERERVFPAMPGRFLTGLDLLIGRDTHDGEGEDGDSGRGIDPKVAATASGQLDAHQPGLGPQEREVFNRYRVLRKSSGMSPHEIRRQIRQNMGISTEHLRQIRHRIASKRGAGWER